MALLHTNSLFILPIIYTIVKYNRNKVSIFPQFNEYRASDFRIFEGTFFIIRPHLFCFLQHTIPFPHCKHAALSRGEKSTKFSLSALYF